MTTKQNVARTVVLFFSLVLTLCTIFQGLASAAGSASVGNSQDTNQSDADARGFPQTRFRIDNDAFWQFFKAYGGTDTFGYPLSRQFRLLGCETQIFQYLVMRQCGDEPVSMLPIADQGFYSDTQFNGFTLPPVDASIEAQLPKPTDPDFASSAVTFVMSNVPDTVNGVAVDFAQAFFEVSRSSQNPTTDEPSTILAGVRLWGLPISRATLDQNTSFVFLRCQNAVLTFSPTTGSTQILALGAEFKALLTADPSVFIPPTARANPLYGAANGGKHPSDSDFTNAFTSQF